MIESINIRIIAICDNTGIQITDLKKVNFIYGANASQKTTVSNFLHNPGQLKFGSCSLVWKNGLLLETLEIKI